MQVKHTFDEGVMWEDNPFEILVDLQCSEYGGSPCRHCHSFVERKDRTRYDNSEFKERRWICPLVVEVTNEGGHNTTGLCVDCLLEAVRDSGLRNITINI